MLTRSATASIALFALGYACLSVACGAPKRDFDKAGGGASSAGTAGGSGKTGGDHGLPAGDAGAGGAGDLGNAGDTGAAGSPDTAGCSESARRCSDTRTPAKCVNGSWVDQEPCPTATPSCSNGLCASVTLSGGILSVADGALSTSSLQLVAHGFDYAQTTCGTVETRTLCVTGGIQP